MKKQTILTVLYAIVAALFLVLAVHFSNGMHNAECIEVSYFETQRLLWLGGAVLFSAGWMVRKTRPAEKWFLVLLGGALIAYTVTMFLLFGGLTTPFDETGYLVANIQLLVIHASALVCFIRALVANAALRDASARVRFGVRVLLAVVAIAAVCLIITGVGTRLVRYEQSSDASYTDFAY